MCLNIGTPKNINFPFETNGKLMISDVPILKHLGVVHLTHFLTGPQRLNNIGSIFIQRYDVESRLIQFCLRAGFSYLRDRVCSIFSGAEKFCLP